MGLTATRGAADLVVQVRLGILSGRYPAGRYLPSLRELGSEHRISPETVRRGLKVLEGEGLIEIRSRKGFRVRDSAALENANCPVAHVTGEGPGIANLERSSWVLSAALQSRAAARGWPTLGVHGVDSSGHQLWEQLAASRAWGVVLDYLEPAGVAKVRELGLPAVMANAWFEGCEIDAVVQDNFAGGVLAARHLLDQGLERIGWLGPVQATVHNRERLAGALSALRERGLELPAGLVEDARGDDLDPAAERLLGGKERPQGILALNTTAARAAARACRSLGLTIGRDVQMVGWTIDEVFNTHYVPAFAGGPVPPAIVWKASTMAEQCLSILAERRAGHGAEAVRVCVQTRLRRAEPAGGGAERPATEGSG